MASLGHIAVGLAAGRLYGKTAGPDAAGRQAVAMAVFAGLSMLPDADVVAFWLGIPYGAPWGHRGASHSLVLAAAAGLVFGLASARLGGSWWYRSLMAAAVLASHGLLDTFTDGGLGAALLWPFSEERFFAAWRPIPVAPIGPRIVSPYGLYVLGFEAICFLPLFVYALGPRRST